MAKKVCRIGDVFGRGNERLVIVGVKKVVINTRFRSNRLGVVYTVTKHGPTAELVDGNAYSMVGGEQSQTTRSAIKLGGWKFVAGPTFDEREAAAKAKAADLTALGKTA